MRCERLRLEAPAAGADDGPRAAGEVAVRLRALAPAGASVRDAAQAIVAAVREGGDRALVEHARRLDGLPPGASLAVAATDLDRALDALEPAVRSALALARANVAAVCRAGLDEDLELELEQGQRIRLRALPVHRAGIYVPGGRSPYASTVVMGVTAAQVAGVQEIAVCAPGAHPSVLAACALCDVREVYRVGGAHAVAALAYGTETIPRVDVVAGPGNLYVQEAKRLVCGDAGIDGFLGPSDVLVLADADADPELVALDLLAQAEHGAGTVVVAVSPDSGLLEDVAGRLDGATDTGAAAAVVVVADLERGLELAEAFAPEHLELVGTGAEALARSVRRAGCVFVGAGGATAFGDYVVGSNHSLPTGGSARFASALSPRHFRRRMAEVHLGAAGAALAPAGAAIARAEGFVVHAESMEARVRDNSPR